MRGDVIQVNARGVAITPAIECANGTKVSEVETRRYKVINSKNSVRWVKPVKQQPLNPAGTVLRAE